MKSYSSECKVLMDEEQRPHLFVTDGSRVYDIDEPLAELIRDLELEQPAVQKELLTQLGLLNPLRPYIDTSPVGLPTVQSISLNVAQACNMSCSYCYADKGNFKGKPSLMSVEAGEKTIDLLFSQASPDREILVGFMGGEPLLARELLYHLTAYSLSKAEKEKKKVAFSLTTNATLLTEDDAQLFRDNSFNITISIDGPAAIHNAFRKMNDHSDGYSKIIDALAIINKIGRPRQLSARVTLTPKHSGFLELLDHLIALGFDDVGFSPVLVSPDKSLQYNESDFANYLEEMKACGRKTIEEIKKGRKYPFGNLESALQEIHNGTHRPFPCGAGAGYLSASSKGDIYACHRFINDPNHKMGSLSEGIDNEIRSKFLHNKHVDKMEPCSNCWARYLCGGGCYYDVGYRGRIACDFIRGWLEFALLAYIELSPATSTKLYTHEEAVSI